MLNIFDIVPEPTIDAVEPITKGDPWVLGYVIIGVLVFAAAFTVTRLVVKKSKKKSK